MKLPKYLARWFKNPSSLKLLFVAALLLLSQAFLSNFYLHYQQKNSVDQTQSMLESILLISAQQQITPLLVNNHYEDINIVLEKSLEQSKTHKIGLYRSNGELIHSVSKGDLNGSFNINTQVKKLIQEEQKLGFLIMEFYDEQSTLSPFSSRYWLFFIAFLLWSLLALLVLLNHSSMRKKSKILNTPMIKVISYKQELQQLLKRNQKNISHQVIKSTLIIEANWDSLKLKPKQPIISLLNRWTAHNESIIEDFTDEYLHLGLTQSVSTTQLQQMQTLEISLIKLGLKPKLLIWSSSFSSTFYPSVFSVLEPGIWLDALLNNEAIEQSISNKPITIEIESFSTLLLHKLLMPKAEVRGSLERQSRFYLE